jgi:hypothetical protein
VVADMEMVAEGKGPLAPVEDGVHAEDDVHRLDQLWPALLHQRDLADAEARGGDRPPDRIGQLEGDEGPIPDDDEELQEVGPRRDEGS